MAVMMVRPITFGFDEQTAATNTFQNETSLSQAEVRGRAVEEFDKAVAELRTHGIKVVVFEDQDRKPKPNAVFPNNWLSMWPDGHIFWYPMATESRRVERSFAALTELAKDFDINEVTNLSAAEDSGVYLESTGVMIFDHEHKIVYGCISPRCDEQLLNMHAATLGYKPIVFHAYNTDSIAIYHTNVLMGVQTTTAVVCADTIFDPAERKQVLSSLQETGHDVVLITQEQMNAFCGNILELQNEQGELFLAMSQTAYDAFTEEQREILSRDKTLIPLSIPTIETIGGGSVRCMLAEVFLPELQRSLD